MTRRVGIIHSEFESQLFDLLPANKGRSSLVYQLISAYELDLKCQQIVTKRASKQDLLKFHDSDYVDELLKRRPHADIEAPSKLYSLLNLPASDDDDNQGDGSFEEDQRLLEKYGLLYDCYTFPLMADYVSFVAGSSISAAQYLLKSPENQISINWNGGRHHAKKNKASGFCYVNDIVLGILELRRKFQKVMYIDLDLHHGDGVETAFKYSDKVITFSIHRKELGFFPGTGSVDDFGKGKGLKSCFNLPIRHGLSNDSFDQITDKILLPTIQKVNPDCLVIQCGCDGLNSDEHKEWNLSIKGFGKQIKKLLNLKVQTLLLGGGGYDHQQAARCWTYLTAIALDDDTEFDILPESFHDPESFEFWNISDMNMIDDNDEAYIESLKEKILGRLI